MEKEEEQEDARDNLTSLTLPLECLIAQGEKWGRMIEVSVHEMACDELKVLVYSWIGKLDSLNAPEIIRNEDTCYFLHERVRELKCYRNNVNEDAVISCIGELDIKILQMKTFYEMKDLMTPPG